MGEARRHSFRFVAEYPCLDFVNTKFMTEGGRRTDPLSGFTALVEWLSESRLVARKQLQRASKLSGAGDSAERVYRSALALREALLSMVDRIAAGRPVPRASLEAINRAISRRSGSARLVRSAGHFEETIQLEMKDPAQLIVPIAASASDLLCRGDLALVKRCANRACGAFFYDTSKNHTRRWCSTTECGNRMRVAAHYRRSRKSIHANN